MTSLTRWRLQPLHNEIRMLQNELNRAFDPFMRGGGDEELMTGVWTPPVDVVEEPEKIVVTVEVPGVRQEEIDINFADGILTIRGERKSDGEANDRKYHRMERSYGAFVRSFTLPRLVDPEKISASYRDGLLTVEVPKREEAKPRQIRIEVK